LPCAHAQEWNVQQLCYEVDVEPYARARDAAVAQLAADAGVQVSAHISHTLYVSDTRTPGVCIARARLRIRGARVARWVLVCGAGAAFGAPDALPGAAVPRVSLLPPLFMQDTGALVAANGGKAPLTMQAFTKLVDRVGDPPAPLAAPAGVPPPAAAVLAQERGPLGVPTLAEVGFADAPTTIFKVRSVRGRPAGAAAVARPLDDAANTPHPRVRAHKRATTHQHAHVRVRTHAPTHDSAPWQGGESQALARLEASLADVKWVCGFEKPATDPSAFEKPATTVLSPYLKFGCLSPRLFYARLAAVYKASRGQHSKPPVSLRGQLLWREFFYTASARLSCVCVCARPRTQAARRCQGSALGTRPTGARSLVPDAATAPACCHRSAPRRPTSSAWRATHWPSRSPGTPTPRCWRPGRQAPLVRGAGWGHPQRACHTTDPGTQHACAGRGA
jgi:hypothetical protein